MGANLAAVEGRTIMDVVPDTDDTLLEVIENFRAGRDQTPHHTRIAGARRWHKSRVSYWFQDDGSVGGYLLIIEDITALRQATEALEAAVAGAEAANAAKSTFLANVSHEIRTPLNGVLGMAQAMARAPLPTAQRERLQVIRQCGEALLALLNDLLDLAKIEAGKVELEDLSFDLVEAVRDACAPFAALAHQKGVTLEITSEAEGHMRRGDPTRLRQVVTNLVSNAVKFTNTGRVTVEIFLRPEGVDVAIRDTGVGMPAEALRTIFEKFSQADASTTRRFGGTGLGLAICRDLVQLMGGEIRVESVPGEGSCFAFSLPLPAAADRPERPARSPVDADRPLRLRVLAAEDNAVNRLVLKALLDQSGVTLTLVENGMEAVAAWDREPWDVILMDVQMPVLDGVAATAEIRRRETAEQRRRTPILALTANAMAHHAAEYAGAGMDGVVSKPIQAEELLMALAAVSERDDSEAQGALPAVG
jgi:signal transduction histidine kinase/ActR/RegA family two-component response regulator